MLGSKHYQDSTTKTFEDMLNAHAASVSTAAAQTGIRGGMSGAEVVERIR
jgi:uncharacterized protein YunC (DUF1805 family)